MKRYALYLLLFLAPVLLLLVVLEIEVRSIPNDYSFKHERIMRDGHSFDFLILGDSHSYRGVDPDLMTGTGFNAANISQDHHFDHLILESYIDEMPGLKKIYIPLSYGSLGSSLERGEERWRVKNYLLYMDVPFRSIVLDHHLELLNHPMKKLVQMVIEHRSKDLDNRSCTNSGAGRKRVGLEIDMVMEGKIAAERHTHGLGDTIVMGTVRLEKLIRSANSKGIQVHLFIPPAWHTYRKELDSDQLELVRRTGERLALENELLQFIDLLEDPRFSREDFHDPDHLSDNGQIKLSQILDQWSSSHEARNADRMN